MARQKGASKGMIVLVNDDTQESTLIIVEPVHVSGGEYDVLKKEGGKLSISVKKDLVVYGELESGVASANASIGTGDDSTTNFTGTLSSVVPGTVTVSVAGVLGLSDNGDGTLTGDLGNGTIDYGTGALDVTFATAPASGEVVAADYYQYI